MWWAASLGWACMCMCARKGAGGGGGSIAGLHLAATLRRHAQVPAPKQDGGGGERTSMARMAASLSEIQRVKRPAPHKAAGTGGEMRGWPHLRGLTCNTHHPANIKPHSLPSSRPPWSGCPVIQHPHTAAPTPRAPCGCPMSPHPPPVYPNWAPSKKRGSCMPTRLPSMNPVMLITQQAVEARNTVLPRNKPALGAGPQGLGPSRRCWRRTGGAPSWGARRGSLCQAQ